VASTFKACSIELVIDKEGLELVEGEDEVDGPSLGALLSEGAELVEGPWLGALLSEGAELVEGAGEVVGCVVGEKLKEGASVGDAEGVEVGRGLMDGDKETEG
jgi:hypothetical protein